MKNKNLANRVKELRKRKGFSQEELTEISGLSLRTIQRIENGETEPRGDTFKRLANALNVTPDELVDWTLQEDKGYLQALNLSALSFLFFPLLGIIIPLIMWISKKDKLKNVNVLAKSIINFQITWIIIFSVGFICNALLLTNKLDTTGVISPTIIINNLRNQMILVVVMYCFNFIMILINSYRIYKEKNIRYFPKINFLRV
ncbi:helix-turn-helix domain-containing protein [Wocania ichthyoenteri]|uniref:helix-turn-helix domain-containing protein n=1 Tax=Wocania ichthyoenteri TaxID=1230531 RepID=UPI00053D4ECA|nr:helix-turn-helix domain-containing protein [Wocania ichthyoenteri]